MAAKRASAPKSAKPAASAAAKADASTGASSSSEAGNAYQVLARRFRPIAFDELVGQSAILESLRSALDAGTVPHALLFSGSRGVGKTTTARILARALNCEQGPTSNPCGTCGACVSVLAGTHPNVVEIDAASHNLVDDIRQLRERVGSALMGGNYKVYILDEVHMLTRSAFNAFLKTLEEPPPKVVFVLATTELHKVPETIRSRCQVLLFQRVGEEAMADRLQTLAEKEGLALPGDVLAEIAHGARGGMRDAETALERILPVAKEVGAEFDLATYRRLVHRVGIDRSLTAIESLLAGDVSQALRFADELVQSGFDEREAMGELVDLLRDLLMLRVDGEASGLVAAAGTVRERLVEVSKAAPPERVEAMLQAGMLGRDRIRHTEDRRILLELTLLRMAQAGQLPTLAELVTVAKEGEWSSHPEPAPAAAAAPPASRDRGGGQGGPSAGEAGAGGAKSPALSVHVPATAPDAAPARSASPPASPSSAESFPASEPPVAAPAPVAAGPSTPVAGLQGLLLGRIRQDKPMVERTIEQCVVEGPDAQSVVHFYLRSDKQLHRDRLMSPELQQDLRTMLVQLLGRDVAVRVHPPGSEAGQSNAANSQSPGEAAAGAEGADGTDGGAARATKASGRDPGPATKKIASRFDGQIVDLDDAAPM